jgi:hypothetical protein
MAFEPLFLVAIMTGDRFPPAMPRRFFDMAVERGSGDTAHPGPASMCPDVLYERGGLWILGQIGDKLVGIRAVCA